MEVGPRVDLGLDPGKVGLDRGNVSLDRGYVGLDCGNVSLERSNLGLDPSNVGLEGGYVGLDRGKVDLHRRERIGQNGSDLFEVGVVHGCPRYQIARTSPDHSNAFITDCTTDCAPINLKLLFARSTPRPAANWRHNVGGREPEGRLPLQSLTPSQSAP